jgi:SAM-dependent methyltransferase
MGDVNLREAANLDFATLDLDFESFRELARNPNLDVHGRIGFPTAYREGHEADILADITVKLPILLEGTGATILDIGPGCANLPRMLIDLCRERGHRLVLVDSEEMLAQLPDAPGVTIKAPGEFPKNREALAAACGDGVAAVLCYSVLHYVYTSGNPFDFVDQIIQRLSPGGRALIGDIPNASKRRRFFDSEAGHRFHQQFTGATEPPDVRFNELSIGRIDDAVLAGLIARAQLAGCDAYLAPQAASLPMANRRDDLLIMRP